MDQLIGNALKGDRRIGVCLSMIILFTCVQCLPSVARCELMYWYSGACNYAYIHAFALIYFGLLIAVANHQGKRRIIDIVLACIMAFIAAGGNQMSSLNGAIVVLTTIGIITWQKKWKQYKLLLIPFLFYLASFVLSMAAPGDWVRMQYTTSMNPVKAVLVSLYYTFSRAVNEWTTWSVILLELMTPPLFAVSSIEAGRIQGLVYWMYILVLTLCLGYAIVWGYQKLYGVTGAGASIDGAVGKEGSVLLSAQSRCEREHFSFDMSCFWITCVACFVWGTVLTVLPDGHYFTFTSAITDLCNGKAQGFAGEMQERLEIYENSETGIVEVYELENQPELLFFSDIKPDSSDWENNAVAKYFDLKEVIWKQGK